MKTIHLFGWVAVVAAVGLASSAQAGVSLKLVLGLPVPVFTASRSVVVYTPPCPPPVVPCPPVVVYQPVPRCTPVVYVAPRYERHDDYRDQRGYDYRHNGHGWGREERSYGHEGRGQERGGRR